MPLSEQMAMEPISKQGVRLLSLIKGKALLKPKELKVGYNECSGWAARRKYSMLTYGGKYSEGSLNRLTSFQKRALGNGLL